MERDFERPSVAGWCSRLACAAVVVGGILGIVTFERRVEFDCVGARVRRTVGCLGIVMVVEEDSAYSEPFGRPGSARWHPVSSSTLWNSTSPHYRYHGILAGLKIIEYVGVDDDVRRAVQRALEHDSPEAVEKLARELADD